jgi:hypothetical protein
MARDSVSPVHEDSESTVPIDSQDSTSDDSDSPNGDSLEESSGDSDSGPGVIAADALSDLSARLHETIPSIVYVSWTQVQETDSVWVEYSFDGEDPEQTPEIAGTLGSHEQIVLGVPYDTDLAWRVVVEDKGESSVEGGPIRTGEAPENLPAIALDVSDESGWESAGRFLLTSVSENDPWATLVPEFWVVLVDRKGRYVWAVPADSRSWTLYPKPSRDGTAILYDDSLYWTVFDGGVGSLVHRIKLDGTELRTWSTPGLAHSFDDLSDTTIAWFRSGRSGDRLVVNEGIASPVVVWDCQDWVDHSDLARANCGANAVFWNEDLGTYTISLWSHETVLEYDPSSDEVLWYSDPVGGHGYTVSPDDAIWDWQHETRLLSADRLLLSSGVDPLPAGGYSATAAYEYEIDHDAGSMELVWSYVSEPEFAATYKGAVVRLDGGNTLQSYGSAAGIKEITPESEVVWQVRFERPSNDLWIGRAFWLEDLYPFGE